ncbi:hypothetical protein NGRA_2209 [Nosema granulosis]|uniref:Uncharacterized protein n=1 Tax=Nosema granulosis TaxID=83296 RepID=A0A9P6GX23_9MICR|nr:hypothetical protein NGRA_2209 [Nosema granulosis]
MENEDLEILRESINKDNLVGRLEKLTVFMDSLSYNIVKQDFPEEDSDLVLERVTIQKKIYEEAHKLYDSIKEEEIDKEEANKALEELSRSFQEFKKLFKKE